ncbi:MAG: hypothetical protein ACR2JJ_04920 [Sphingomicrobium sp.]
MSWSSKYWDAVHQFYWEPSYLGLASIPKGKWGNDPKVIQLSKSLIQDGGTLYTRRGTSKENLKRLLALEETLNHVFEITFAIAPDAVIAECFCQPLGIEDAGPFARLGREVAERYVWGNVTQQDGYFVSSQSAVGVELKLSAPTSATQVLKYLALMVQEQKVGGGKKSLGLLYVTPKVDPASLWKQCAADANGQLADDWLSQFEGSQLNPTLGKLLQTYPSEFADAARKVRLGHISWQCLAGVCRTIVSRLSPHSLGDEALIRLLSGFVEAVERHEGAQVNPPSAKLRVLSILESIRQDMGQSDGALTMHLVRLERALGSRVESFETPAGDALRHVLARLGVWAEGLQHELLAGELPTADVAQVLGHLSHCADLGSLSCSE